MKCKSSDYNGAPTAGMEPRPLLLQLGLLAILVASTSLLLVACKSMNSSVSARNRLMATPTPGLFSWPGFQVSPGIHLMTAPTAFTGISPNHDDTGNEVDFGTNIGNFGTDDFTLSFWIKQSPDSTAEYACFEKRVICQASISLWEILIGGGDIGWAEVPPGHLATYICGDNNENVATLVSQQAINDGVFHQVVLTRKGKTISYYIDGEIDTSKTMDGIANVNNSGMFRAGQSVCVPPGVGGSDRTRPFVGELDRVDLFDRALSAAEIATFHRAGRSGTDASADESTPKPAHTNAVMQPRELLRMVVDTACGDYVEASANREVLMLKNKFNKTIWSTNLVQGLKNLHLAGEEDVEKRIAKIEIIEGKIYVYVHRDLVAVDKRTGEVTYEGAD